ncbi:MAG TPA: NADP-dependent oxidoreductase [Stellaceae bacterium]|nr:NADP-dependent oxidoreductase [Stellaceae bacterium]
MAEKNLQVLLAARPKGAPKDSDFRLAEAPVPEPGPGEMLLRTIYLSLDPYMRLRMNETSHLPPFEIGKPLLGATASVVVKSNLPEYREGEFVVALHGWTTYALSNGTGMFGRPLQRLDPKRGPLSAQIWILGSPGLTAYKGLLAVAQPKEGETVVVSGASGAVGSIVGQIARMKGCRTVGIAGGAQKSAYVTGTLGFDSAVDYKAGDLAGALKAACPKGVDIYYENVGGAVFEAVLPLLNNFARVPVCGNVAEYNAVERRVGPDRMPDLMLAILGHRLTLRGFVVSDFMNDMQDFVRDMGAWLAEGKIHYREDIADGLAAAPQAFIRMLAAQNFGKPIVRVSPDPGA